MCSCVGKLGKKVKNGGLTTLLHCALAPGLRSEMIRGLGAMSLLRREVKVVRVVGNSDTIIKQFFVVFCDVSFELWRYTSP